MGRWREKKGSEGGEKDGERGREGSVSTCVHALISSRKGQ